MKTSLVRKLAMISITVGLGAACSSVSAAPWTTVGSAGTVDEADTQTIDLSGAGANIANTAPLPATATIRYNVVAVDGLLANFGNLGGVHMSAVFRDNGSTARIRLRLREVENATGTLRTRLTLDSNAFPAASGFQRRSVDSCASGTPFNFDFERKAYFIEAEIERGSAAGLPTVGTILVHPVSCVHIE